MLVDFDQSPKKPMIYVKRVILIAVKLDSALVLGGYYLSFRGCLTEYHKQT